MKLNNFDVPGYYVGDARELLRQLPDQSINCCVTSPPYWGLRDYGVSGQLGLEETPDKYAEEMVAVFREVNRVLRDDGTLFLNLGDSYAQGSRGGIGDKSTLEGGQSSQNASRFKSRPSFRRDGAPVVAVANRQVVGLKPKNLIGIPWRVAFALQDDGWYLRSDIIWSKVNAMPDSVTDRPTKAHEYVFLLSKSEHYFYDIDAIREPHTMKTQRRLSPIEGRPKYGHAQPHTEAGYRTRDAVGVDGNPKGRNKRTVWTISTESYPDAHFATMPTKLVEPCILSGCPSGGIVLDPFMGSGTVARVATDLGRLWLGFDLNPDYAQLAAKRMAQTSMMNLASAPTAPVSSGTSNSGIQMTIPFIDHASEETE